MRMLRAFFLRSCLPLAVILTFQCIFAKTFATFGLCVTRKRTAGIGAE